MLANMLSVVHIYGGTATCIKFLRINAKCQILDYNYIHCIYTYMVTIYLMVGYSAVTTPTRHRSQIYFRHGVHNFFYYLATAGS